MSKPYEGKSANQNVPGLTGVNTANGEGVHGESEGGTGVAGKSKTWAGIYGESESSSGVYGKSKRWAGVLGESESGSGVYGKSESTSGGAGVLGEGVGPGVIGKSKTWFGVFGESEDTTTGVGVYGKGGRVAGYFEGNVEVTGDIRLTNADCAEDFDIGDADQVEPGTVMVLGEDGKLQQSQQAYDKRVAGVISGAGDYKPGIVLDRQPSTDKRAALAMVGKVCCKVDAQYGAIQVGDLLTTSPTPGHAMKPDDPTRAFGAVIGKALRSLNSGTGLVPLLVALQ